MRRPRYPVRNDRAPAGALENGESMPSLDFWIFIVPKPAKMNLPKEFCLTPAAKFAAGRSPLRTAKTIRPGFNPSLRNVWYIHP